MSLEIDVTKSMCLRSSQDVAIENRLQSIVTDWKTEEEDFQHSEQSSLNNSQNLDHLLTNQKLLIPTSTEKNNGTQLNKTKLFLSFPLKRLFALGRGASSIVYKTVKLNNLRIYAEKVLVVSDPVKKKQIIREIESLRSMFSRPLEGLSPISSLDRGESGPFSPEGEQTTHCPYVVELYDVLQNPLDGTLSLCLEYMNNGSLQDVVGLGGCSSEAILAAIAAQILRGLRFLHGHRIVHRDVKPSNILLSLDGRVKLSDFGLAKTMDLGHSLADSFLGTFEYMAPERLAGEAYGFSSDIWSAGLSLHTLALGRFPYAQKNGFWELLHATQQDARPLPDAARFSAAFIELVAAATARQMAARPSASALLRYPFVAEQPDVVPAVLWADFMRELAARKKTARPSSSSSAQPKAAALAPVAAVAAAPLRISPRPQEKAPVSARRREEGIGSARRPAPATSTALAAEKRKAENSSRPPLPAQAQAKEPTSARFVSPRVAAGRRANESPAHSRPSPTHKKAAASPSRAAGHKDEKPSGRISRASFSSDGPKATPRSSRAAPGPHKQSSLPAIPSASSSQQPAQQTAATSPRRVQSLQADLTLAPPAPLQEASPSSSSAASKIPPIPLHQLSPSPTNPSSAPKTPLASLHAEKQLTAAELSGLVAEWGRFAVKFAQQDGLSLAAPPALSLTTAAIRELSADLRCEEGPLLGLFVAKVREVQRQLGDSEVVQFLDQPTRPSPANPSNPSNPSKSSPSRQQPQPSLRSSKLKSQTLRDANPSNPSSLTSGSFSPRSSAEAKTAGPKKSAASSKDFSATSQQAGSKAAAFQLTIAVDGPRQRRGPKSIRDFEAEEPEDGRTSSLQQLQTLATSAESLERQIELDGLDWAAYQTAFQLGDQPMPVPGLRSLDSRLPNLTPPAASQQGTAARLHTSLTASKELLQRSGGEADFLNNGLALPAAALLLSPSEDAKVIAAARRSQNGRPPLLSSVSSDDAKSFGLGLGPAAKAALLRSKSDGPNGQGELAEAGAGAGSGSFYRSQDKTPLAGTGGRREFLLEESEEVEDEEGGPYGHYNTHDHSFCGSDIEDEADLAASTRQSSADYKRGAGRYNPSNPSNPGNPSGGLNDSQLEASSILEDSALLSAQYGDSFLDLSAQLGPDGPAADQPQRRGLRKTVRPQSAEEDEDVVEVVEAFHPSPVQTPRHLSSALPSPMPLPPLPIRSEEPAPLRHSTGRHPVQGQGQARAVRGSCDYSLRFEDEPLAQALRQSRGALEGREEADSYDNEEFEED